MCVSSCARPAPSGTTRPRKRFFAPFRSPSGTSLQGAKSANPPAPPSLGRSLPPFHFGRPRPRSRAPPQRGVSLARLLYSAAVTFWLFDNLAARCLTAAVTSWLSDNLAARCLTAAVTSWLSDNLAVRPLQVENPRPPRSFGRVSVRRSSLSVVHRPAPCRPRSRLPPKGTP